MSVIEINVLPRRFWFGTMLILTTVVPLKEQRKARSEFVWQGGGKKSRVK